MTSKSTLTILSIDGGGIRGVVPLQLLCKLEQELRTSLNDKHFHLGSCFDVLSGTSTGAIITAGLSMPAADGKSYAYDAAYVLKAYIDAGHKIFSASTWESFKSLGGLRASKYSSRALEKYFDFFFKKKAMHELLNDNMIVAYDLENRSPFLFTGGKNFKNSPFQIKDALRASTSAPIYFAPANIKDHNNNEYTLIDGGVVANSSTLVLLQYLLEHKFIDRNTELNWLSLGTGITPPSFSPADLDGAFSWLFPMVDIMNSGAAMNVTEQTKIILENLFSNSKFVRINPSLQESSENLDDASTENLKALQDSALVYIDTHKNEWEALIQLLLKSINTTHA